MAHEEVIWLSKMIRRQKTAMELIQLKCHWPSVERRMTKVLNDLVNRRDELGKYICRKKQEAYSIHQFCQQQFEKNSKICAPVGLFIK